VLTHTGSVPESLDLPTGTFEQRVPMTAAVRVEGERLYKRAHRGEEVETPTREVTVHRAELLSSDDERATYEIECAAGTYVRTLVETLGDAYCESLRRTKIDDLSVERAGEELDASEALGFMPERALSEEEARRVGHGQRLAAGGEPEGRLRLTHDGSLVAVALHEGGALRPEVVVA
jgi:tRNA pseudouridine55 synthase